MQPGEKEYLLAHGQIPGCLPIGRIKDDLGRGALSVSNFGAVALSVSGERTTPMTVRPRSMEASLG
ncbi:hypothetical protein DVDV_1532 [Desulfovibrio sp. DV]|nr:hypothetical protein DVDV_1532 [Desulfovibrio sp. DV]